MNFHFEYIIVMIQVFTSIDNENARISKILKYFKSLRLMHLLHDPSLSDNRYSITQNIDQKLLA